MTYTCLNDSSHTKPEEIPKITMANGYAFVTSGHAYTLRSGKTVLMTVKRSSGDEKTYGKFEELVIDGDVVDADSYEKASGSVKLTLKSSYLDKLSKGTHSVRFNFIDGYADSTLKITSSGSGGTPGTGDDTKTNNIVSAMILFLLSLSFVAYTVYDNQFRPKLPAVPAGVSSFFSVKETDAVDAPETDTPFDESKNIVFYDADLESLSENDSFYDGLGTEDMDNGFEKEDTDGGFDDNLLTDNDGIDNIAPEND